MTAALEYVLRHNAWATRTLLEHCASLGADALELEAGGTYGTLYGTLQHIVGAEQWYVSLITDEVLGSRIRKTERRSLDELMKVAAMTGPRAIEIATSDDAERAIALGDEHTTVGIVLAQLVHHANEHRAHATTILGANGRPRRRSARGPMVLRATSPTLTAIEVVMTDLTLLRAIRHNNWANLEMLAFCSRMSASQLEWNAEGVYGTIHATLQHILGAEAGYLHSLTGGELPPGGRPPDTLMPLDKLADLARSNAERIEKVLANETDPDRKITRPSGAVVPATIIVAQFIHHGSDHRAHIGTILGAHKVEGPNLDAWAFGRAIGVSTAAVR